MAGEFAVELRDVVKKFMTPEGNELAAVDHVTMQIKNGEFFSMLGSSGCGKTTSLRLIAGFEWPTEGEVYIEGKSTRTYASISTKRQYRFSKLCIIPALDRLSERSLRP